MRFLGFLFIYEAIRENNLFSGFLSFMLFSLVLFWGLDQFGTYISSAIGVVFCLALIPLALYILGGIIILFNFITDILATFIIRTFRLKPITIKK
ncbi:hypothetical protein CN931_25140 [Bacillus sp. AFS054943]|uniref:Uncharacterized protein n=1 Tax=Bacillus cereus TaxID=1396 RepID=A0A2C1LNG9_BACCE|nr:hypothetical protein [Bacillus cereus]MBE7123417.1 hypothetical protein [Bacillus cereus]PGL77240.1 hypothetical protein CN931_25140 [Bacillus sp. AFS054943]PGT99481.1 hypothetical protein COD19_19380 [Bacillus cereus]